MICPWCKENCGKNIEEKYFRYYCKCNTVNTVFSPYNFICYVEIATNQLFIFNMYLISGSNCYLDLTHNRQSFTTKLILSDRWLYKPGQELQVPNGLLTPEDAVNLLKKYSKLMAFI